MNGELSGYSGVRMKKITCGLCGKGLLRDHPRRKYHPACVPEVMRETLREWRKNKRRAANG